MTEDDYNRCANDFADAALRFAVRCGGSIDASKDAVQEAFASLWKRRKEVDTAKARSFILSTVYRQLQQDFRRLSVARQHAPALQGDLFVEPNNTFDLRAAIEVSLQTLPDIQRAILHLRDVEGYSYREIADTLNIDNDKVQVYLFRARVKMQKQLKSMGYDNNR